MGKRPPDPPGRGESAALSITQPSTLDMPKRLVDLTTGLPSLTSLFDELGPLAEHSGGATIYYVHLPSNRLIEERFGWETLEAYDGLVSNFLCNVATDAKTTRSHCVVARAFADDYVLVASGSATDEVIRNITAEGMREHIDTMDNELAAIHEVYVGMAQIAPFPKIHPERLLYRGIQQAQSEATDVGRQKISIQTRLLDRCIARRNFSMVFQPIVRLADREIFAYEALVRCPEQQLRNPHVLFSIAEQGGRIWPLSRLLRSLAVDALPQMPDDALLFINLHPSDFDDPELITGEPRITEHAHKLILEVTERAAITDFDRFSRNVQPLRDAGIRIAVDDLGSGYAALSSVTEINPDFIKFDMTLIRDIDASPIRQNLLRNMISFAADTGTEVIAEGVETKEELATLCELGSDYVQGYYLGRPKPGFDSQTDPE
jgi:EAL domain-containing protein (putative c-di-GMP-specific phosphodiesterase class I)